MPLWQVETMTKHLTDDQLIAYAYRTLTDDLRAEMDRHLSACADCRAQLAEHEALQRRVHYRVIAHRNAATPPASLVYAAIATRVNQPERGIRLGSGLNNRFFAGALAAAALLVLIILLISMFSSARQITVNPRPTFTPPITPITPMTPKLVWKIEAKPGELHAPNNLILDTQDNLYVFDEEDRILKYDRDGQFLTQWGSTGRGDGQLFTGGRGEGIASDAQGNIYVVDRGNVRIQKFDSMGKFLLKWGERGDGPGQFQDPQAVAVDAQGNVYVINVDQNRVQKFDGSGQFLLQWGKESFAPGESFTPFAITIDRRDFVYLMDQSYGTIQIFDRNGKFIVKWKLQCGDNQPVQSLDLATDLNGNVYVTDFYSSRICKFDANGQFLYAWGEKGAADSQFDWPDGIAVDGQNNVYVADFNNNRVLKFSQP